MNRWTFSLVASIAMATACARPQASTVVDPRVWRAVPCTECDARGIRVETRRSMSANGRPGTYHFARVTNLNTHAVVFTLDLSTPRLLAGDPDVVARQWRLVLPEAEHPASSTVLSVDHLDVASARVYGLEKF